MIENRISYSNRSIQSFFFKTWHRLFCVFRQCLILTQRYWDLKKQDPWYLLILILQSPLIGLLLVLVFYGGDPYSGSLMFVFTISAFWFGAFSSIREIVSEQAIYHRERMIDLNITAYVFSKIPILFTISIVQCFILLLIACFGVALDKYLGIGANLSRMAAIFSVLVLTAFTGVTFGLMLSSLSIIFGKKTINRTGMISSEVAMSLIPFALLPQIILGGPFLIYEKVFWITKLGSKLMVLRWALSALLNLERSGPQALAKQLGMRGESIMVSCCIIIFFSILFILLTIISLKLEEMYSAN